MIRYSPGKYVETKWRAALDTAMRASSLFIYRSSTTRPAQYEKLKPPNAWNVATFGHFAESRIWNDRNGTNGSWWWMTSNRSRSSMREISHSRRTESVMRPTLPLTGSAGGLTISVRSEGGE